MQRHRWLPLLALLIYIATLPGCSSLGYYWQAINGHFAITSREQPVSELLQQADLDPILRHKLELAQRARRFASEHLALPDNASYTRYADLKRPYVTWNVVATPEFSVEPKRWCYLVAGCFNYRGYFHEQDAKQFAHTLKQQGFDVAISGAWAYSTLGWFDDPLLNTMLMHDDADVIGTLFHELAHQTVYIDDDSSFNESFANAVEQEGLRRWYLHIGQPAQYQAFLQRRQQRDAILQLLEDTRDKLRKLFAKPLNDVQKRRQKQALFAALKKQYQVWREQHSYAGYDRWMQQDLNNAHLALIATYTDKVPAFLAMLASVKGNLPAFYQAVKRIGALPPAQRQAALEAYQHAP
jgi:predicted aminopeptidase